MIFSFVTGLKSSGDEVPSQSEAAAEGSSTPQKKKKRKWYFQSFKQEWLQDEALKDWLQADQSVKHRPVAICKVCDVKFKHANKTALLNHKDTQKHKRNFNAEKSSTQIHRFF